jgi:Flp pilus assembly protein TadD
MYEKAIQLNANSPVPLRNLAQAYRRSGQEQKAITTYDRAISAAYSELQVNPQNADVMGTLAMCYAAKGELSRAQQLIQRARSIDGADSGLMYDEAVVFSLRGLLPDALTSLRRALQSGASFEDAMKDPDLAAVRSLAGFKPVAKMFGQTADARRRKP